MRTLPLAAAACVLLSAASAAATECVGRPDAVGTARVITVDPTEHARIGTMQYQETLPLADKEVVLTFDDGPVPPYTGRVLETLASECVKATFFLVGRQARAFPETVRRIYNAGHTLATHSQNHPIIFTRLSQEQAQAEIDNGIASVVAALGDSRALAPFFRFPGLGRSDRIEAYLGSKSLMTWSADFPADDWTKISAQQVMDRALERLERKGKGVLLLHDIQPATALALPTLLKELKARGYRIVHVVPAGPERPKTVTEPAEWRIARPARQGWPRLAATPAGQLPAPSARSFGWPRPFFRPAAGAGVLAGTAWPLTTAGVVQVAETPEPPQASLANFGVGEAFGPDIVLPATLDSEAAIPLAASKDVLKSMVRRVRPIQAGVPAAAAARKPAPAVPPAAARKPAPAAAPRPAQAVPARAAGASGPGAILTLRTAAST